MGACGLWLLAAVGSALFAGVTAVLAKLGVRETDSDLVTALVPGVVLAWPGLVRRERLPRRARGGLVLLVAGTLAIAAA